jgi:chemotaxis signal transduction protein
MQAFANEMAEKLSTPAGSDNNTLDVMENQTSLFSADEIIFPDESVDRPYTRYGYTVGNFNFLIPESTASEVIQKPSIYNLPNSPSWIEGLINIRGNIIPVMNIAKLLKITISKNPESILVLEKTDSNAALGIMINDLPVSLEIGESKTSTDDYPDILLDYINAGFNQNNADWIEFDPQQLFKKLADK